jgi:hypothetical protein
MRRKKPRDSKRAHPTKTAAPSTTAKTEFPAVTSGALEMPGAPLPVQQSTRDVSLARFESRGKMSALSSCSSARLADHIRACRVGNQMIFLDLLRDKYIGLGGPHMDALSAVICGSTPDDDPSVQPLDTALLARYVRRLRQQQLLSNEPPHEPRNDSPHFDPPMASLSSESETGQESFEWGRLLQLWHSTFVAGTWLRWHNLSGIASRLSKLRAKHVGQGGQKLTDAVRASVNQYIQLRPFALSSHDRCLNDSLTLIHFLTTQGLSAQWVIGVKVRPFEAHSWAQAGDVVLNDFAERVRHYQPILIV